MEDQTAIILAIIASVLFFAVVIIIIVQGELTYNYFCEDNGGKYKFLNTGCIIEENGEFIEYGIYNTDDNYFGTFLDINNLRLTRMASKDD